MENIGIAIAPSIATERPLRLFLVEDSQSVRDFLVDAVANIHGLQLAGMSETENDARKQLSEQNFDIMILDIELKQGNGINLLRAIQQNAWQSRMYKIIFSNSSNELYRKLCAKNGSDFFFDKMSDFLLLNTLLQKIAAHAAV